MCFIFIVLCSWSPAFSTIPPVILFYPIFFFFLNQRFSNVCPTENDPSIFQDLNGCFWQSSVCLICFSCHFYEEHVMKFLSLHLAPILLSCLLIWFSSCYITSSYSSLFPHNSKWAHYFVLVWILPMFWRLECKKLSFFQLPCLVLSTNQCLWAMLYY